MSQSASRLLGVLSLSQAWFLAATFGQWPVVVLFTLLLGVIIYARQRRVGLSDPPPRPWIWRLLRGMAVTVLFTTIVLLTSIWRIGSQFSENINVVYVGSDALAHSALFCSLTVWALRPRRGHVSMLPLGLILVLLCVAAGGASLSLAGQTTVALATCLGFTLASQIILGTQRGTDGSIFARDRSQAGRPAWLAPVFSLITLSLLMMATSAIANGTSRVLPGLQEMLQQQLEEALDPLPDDAAIGGTRYVRGSKLGSIRRHLLGDPQAIALKINSSVAPGYLRGTVFDAYLGRRWLAAAETRYRQFQGIPSVRNRSIAPIGDGTVSLVNPVDRPLKRFPMDESSAKQIITLEVQNDPLKGQLIFLPLTTRWIEAHSRELVVSAHDTVQFGVDVSKPYVAGAAMTVSEEQIDKDRRRVLLSVPGSIAPQFRSLADQLCNDAQSPQARAKAISKYFQTEYKYSLAAVKVPRGTDPLIHFLESKHDAHCEFFASATVLTLRSAGVPARYVTGYVADEFNDETDHWLARHRDAHAWAEAYDDQSNRWFPVESTPGRTYLTVSSGTTSLTSESFFDVFGNDNGDESDSFISRALGWLFAMRISDPLLLVFRVAQLPLFCVLALLLWARYIKPSRGMDPTDQQSRRMLRRADRKVRKFSLVRAPGETLYQFADRIDARGRDPQTPLRQDIVEALQHLSAWYRQYADARYQGQLPKPL